jgi:GAF domain-containing protein
MIAPLVAEREVRGYLYADIDGAFGRFGEPDRDLLNMLASQAAVALANAHWSQSLEQKVEQRTEELRVSNTQLEQRASELAVINSIQQGMAASLDFQGIIDLVGDQLREVFHTGDLAIRWWDEQAGTTDWLYSYEHGKRLYHGRTSLPEGGPTHTAITTRKPQVLNTRDGPGRVVPGTDMSLCLAVIPIVGSDRVLGTIQVENYEREDAFGEAEVRLLTTVAASMGVALESARNFGETQRLLKETEQRAAELAVINSIQQGIAAELKFQAIIDLVGDKLREVLKAPDIGIDWYDPQANLLHHVYVYEKGRRLYVDPSPPRPAGPWSRMVVSRKPEVANTRAELAASGVLTIPGTLEACASVTVPIVGADRVLGLVAIDDYERENVFGESEVRLLTTVAASMGVALENARLFDETQRLFKAEQERVAELAVINSIQQGIASKLHFQGIIDLVGEKLREVFNTGNLGIRLHDRRTNMVHYVYEYEHGKRISVPPAAVSRDSLVARELLEGRVILLRDAADRERWQIKTIPGTDTSKSGVFVPIIGSDGAIGAIVLENYEREHAFGEAQVRLLTTVAASMGVAIESARNFGETQRLLKETEQRNAELAVINSIQQGVSENLDFQKIINLVGDKMREVFNTGEVSIKWWDRATNMLHTPYGYEHGVRYEIAPNPVKPGGLPEKVLRERKIGLLNTVAEAVAAGIKVVEGTDTPLSSIRVPIVAGDHALGYIMLENYEREHAFGEPDIRLLTTVANGMGVALENARLFDETQRLFKAEQERVAELAVINSIQQGISSKLDFQAIVGPRRRQAARGVRDRRPRDPLVGPEGERDDLALRVRARQAQPFRADEGARGRAHGAGARHAPAAGRQHRGPFQARKRARRRAHPGHRPVQVHGGRPDHRQRPGAGHHPAREPRARGRLQRVADQPAHDRREQHGGRAENARLFDETQHLFKAEQARVAELAVINSIQQGMSAKLDFQAIVELVGDKLREVFNTGNLSIRWLVEATNSTAWLYSYEHGKRIQIAPTALTPGGATEVALKTRKPRTVAIEATQDIIPGTDHALCMAVIPIIGSDRALGTIQIESFERADAFGEAEIRLLTTVAGGMGIALESASNFAETQRLLKETEQRNTELAVINSVQQGMASKLDFQGIVDLAGDKLRDVLRTGDLSIWWHDEQTNLVHLPYTYEHGQRLSIEPRPPSPTGTWTKLLKTRAPVVTHTAAEVQARGVLQGTDAALSSAAVPILAADRLIGAISVESFEREHAFGDSELRILQTIAGSMGVALENARLFKAEQERVAELAVINSIQQGMAGSLDFQGIVDLVGGKLREVLHTENIGIRWYDHDAKQVHYLHEFEHGVRLEITPQPIQGSHTKLIAQRQPILYRSNAEMVASGHQNVPGTDHSKSMLTVPIIGSDRVLGSILVENYEREDAYGESEVRLMQTVAASMGVALENARLFDETQRLLKETEQRNAELAVINSIQQGMASKLEFQAIIDLVGDKLRDVLHTGDIGIRWLDETTGLIHYLYEYEHGKRLAVPPRAPSTGGPCRGWSRRGRRWCATPKRRTPPSPCCRERRFLLLGRRTRDSSQPRDRLHRGRGPRTRACVRRHRGPAAANHRGDDGRGARQRAPLRRDAAPLQGERAARGRARDHQQRAGSPRREARHPGDLRHGRRQDRHHLPQQRPKHPHLRRRTRPGAASLWRARWPEGLCGTIRDRRVHASRDADRAGRWSSTREWTRRAAVTAPTPFRAGAK